MKKRIAIVASHPIQYHAHWYRELARSPELDVEVLYCHEPTPSQQAEAGFGVEFSWDTQLLGGYRHRFLRNVSVNPGVTGFGGTDTPELGGLIRRERFDAVAVSGWHTKSYWQAIRACWNSGTPVMARSDSHLHEVRSTLKKMLKWGPYRYFIPRLDACLAVGTWSRDYFLHYGAKPERVFIVPHCAPGPGPVTADGGGVRAGWKIGESACVFLFAGKFISRKRPLDFILAIAAAASSGMKVHGLLVGDGPLRGEMESLAARLHAPVSFAGFLNQSAMPDAYTAADVLVLPSGRETWGLVVNEAMIHGLPCIVSDRVGCGPDLIEAGRTGFIFPTGDVEALAGYMRQIANDSGMNNSGMASRMGAAAKLLIAGHSAPAAVAGFNEAIAAIMKNG